MSSEEQDRQDQRIEQIVGMSMLELGAMGIWAAQVDMDRLGNDDLMRNELPKKPWRKYIGKNGRLLA